MSLQSSTINLTKSELPDTYYFHRNYRWDLPYDHSWKRECPWLFLARRIANTGLPLLSLYKPLHTPLALTLGAMRVYNFGNVFNNSRGEEECLFYGINTALATCALAATFFNRSAGALITTGQDILIMLYCLYDGFEKTTYTDLLFAVLGIANNALYLALLLSGGAQLAVASIAMQVIAYALTSVQHYQNDNQIEAIGCLATALARGQQVREYT